MTFRRCLRDGREILRIPWRTTLAACLVTISFAPPADGQCTGCPNPSFAGGAAAARVGFTSPAGAFPAELNRGVSDLIVTTDSFSQQALTIFFSDGFGHFTFPLTLNLPGPSRGAVTGDFTGDGFPDILATGSGFPSGLFLFRGTAVGGFEPPQNLDPSTATFHMVAGDFNGDGRLDAAVTHTSPLNSVRFYLGNGSGGISATAEVPAGPNITSLTIGDFNADGRTDVVATNGNSNTFSVILGVASPPFPPATNFVVGFSPLSAGSADFNGDGDADLAVSNNENRVSVLLGTGIGSFLPPVHLAAGPGTVAVGDFQGDGKSDLALVGQSDLWILTGSGTGTFTIARAPGWRGTPVASDFTRDGLTDLAIVTSSFSFSSPTETNIFLIQGSASGLKTPPSTSLDGFSSPGVLAAADFSGDTIPDLATADIGAGGVRILLGTGLGTFTGGQVLTNLFGVVDIEAADLNGDGQPDLAVLLQDRVMVYLGTGNGQFGPSAPFMVGNGTRDLTRGDLNRDGVPDLVSSNGSSNSISVLLGLGNGTFQSQGKYAVGSSPGGLVITHLDGDLNPDVAVVVGDSIAVLRGNGTGSFLSIESFPAGTDARFPVSADFNGDGEADVAVLTGFFFSQTSTVSLLAGDGAGHLAAPVNTTIAGTPSGLVTTDLNQDGAPDLFVAGAATGIVLINTPSGFNPFEFWIGDPVYTLAVADFAPNGLPDIAIGSSNSRAIIVLPNTNCRPASLLISEPGGCIVPGAPFPFQPIAQVQDDGGNRIFCDTGMVTASLVPGTGAPGAVLGGTTTVSATAGVAIYFDLSVDRAGSRYRLEFTHPVAGSARSAAFSTAPTGMIAAASSVCPYSSGNMASVADAGPRATYAWSISNGSITSGVGTPNITFRAGPFGQTTISVSIQTPQGCAASGNWTLTIDADGCPSPVGFFTVTPCRLADTRDAAGPFGGPPLSLGTPRTFVFASRCGIPPTAKALSLNITVDQPASAGHVTVYPGGTPLPSTSTLNYSAGQTRANNAILALGADQDLTAQCAQATGTVHLILDVNGYFE